MSSKRGLEPLSPYKQFIIWQLAAANGGVARRPINHRNRYWADVSDCRIRLDIIDAVVKAQNLNATCDGTYGVGFVLTTDDPFFLVTIDNCRDDRGELQPVAADILAMLRGAAVEISQSGQKLHIVGSGAVPAHRRINAAGIELHTHDRFIALDGQVTLGSAATDCTEMLPSFISAYLQPEEAEK